MTGPEILSTNCVIQCPADQSLLQISCNWLCIPMPFRDLFRSSLRLFLLTFALPVLAKARCAGQFRPRVHGRHDELLLPESGLTLRRGQSPACFYSVLQLYLSTTARIQCTQCETKRRPEKCLLTAKAEVSKI